MVSCRLLLQGDIKGSIKNSSDSLADEDEDGSADDRSYGQEDDHHEQSEKVQATRQVGF